MEYLSHLQVFCKQILKSNVLPPLPPAKKICVKPFWIKWMKINIHCLRALISAHPTTGSQTVGTSAVLNFQAWGVTTGHMSLSNSLV